MLESMENTSVQIITKYWDDIELIHVPMKIIHVIHIYRKKLNYISNLLTVKYSVFNCHLRVTLSASL